MPTFSVELPADRERGIRVVCEDHDQATEFQPGYRTVAFHCNDCGYELELSAHDLHEWRDLGEWC